MPYKSMHIEQSVLVNGTWVSFSTFRRRKELRRKAACVGFVALMGIMLFISLWAL